MLELTTASWRMNINFQTFIFLVSKTFIDFKNEKKLSAMFGITKLKMLLANLWKRIGNQSRMGWQLRHNNRYFLGQYLLQIRLFPKLSWANELGQTWLQETIGFTLDPSAVHLWVSVHVLLWQKPTLLFGDLLWRHLAQSWNTLVFLRFRPPCLPRVLSFISGLIFLILAVVGWRMPHRTTR